MMQINLCLYFRLLIYLITVCSVILPIVSQKYPEAHKFLFLRRYLNSCRNKRLENPFNILTINETE